MEFFVPVENGEDAIRAAQKLVDETDFGTTILLYMRQIPGNAIAPLSPSYGSDVLCVEADVFFSRDWDTFAEIFRVLRKELQAVPGIPFVRAHTGKYIAPGFAPLSTEGGYD